MLCFFCSVTGLCDYARMMVEAHSRIYFELSLSDLKFIVDEKVTRLGVYYCLCSLCALTSFSWI